MRSHTGWLRPIAAALLWALPAVGSAETVLEIRESVETGAAFERHHLVSCLRLHDHGFCLLSQRAPWARSEPVAHAFALPPACDEAEPPGEPRSLARAGLEPVQPRSPPVLA